MTIVERFLKYVSFDTQSGDASGVTPSTAKQFTFAEYLKEEEDCDMVICLTHLGFEDEDYTDCELAAKVRNVDVIVGGHSHTHLDDGVLVKGADGEEIVVVQSWKWGRIMGKLSVDF